MMVPDAGQAERIVRLMIEAGCGAPILSMSLTGTSCVMVVAVDCGGGAKEDDVRLVVEGEPVLHQGCLAGRWIWWVTIHPRSTNAVLEVA
jgi:hypothetical protein